MEQNDYQRVVLINITSSQCHSSPIRPSTKIWSACAHTPHGLHEVHGWSPILPRSSPRRSGNEVVPTHRRPKFRWAESRAVRVSTLSKLSLESTNTPFVIRAGVSSLEAGAPATRLGVKSSALGSAWTLVTVVVVCCLWSVALSLCRGLFEMSLSCRGLFEMLRVLLMSGSTHVLRAGAVLLTFDGVLGAP